MRIYEKNYGKDDYRVGNALESCLRASNGKLLAEELREQYTRLLTIREKQWGAESPKLLPFLWQAGQTFYLEQNYKEAREYYRRGHELSVKHGVSTDVAAFLRVSYSCLERRLNKSAPTPELLSVSPKKEGGTLPLPTPHTSDDAATSESLDESLRAILSANNIVRD